MTDRPPVAEGPPPLVPPVIEEYDYNPLEMTLHSVQRQGAAALVNLEGAIQQAERFLLRMRFYIDRGVAGAEAVPALETAIADARQVQAEMTTLLESAQMRKLELEKNERASHRPAGPVS